MDPANTTTRFRGTMEGVRLLDIVQLCCRTTATGCLEVKNGKTSGTLWLRGGEIVHAESGTLRGEDAALKILTWRYGDFTLRRNVTAPVTSIVASWEGLIMRAACSLDESPVKPEAVPQAPGPPGASGRDPSVPSAPAGSGATLGPPDEAGERRVLLLSLGETVHRLARDIGDALGLGPPLAVYGWGAAHRVTLEIAADGSAHLSTGRMTA